MILAAFQANNMRKTILMFAAIAMFARLTISRCVGALTNTVSLEL